MRLTLDQSSPAIVVQACHQRSRPTSRGLFNAGSLNSGFTVTIMDRMIIASAGHGSSRTKPDIRSGMEPEKIPF
jgi:hypothetical protein